MNHTWNLACVTSFHRQFRESPLPIRRATGPAGVKNLAVSMIPMGLLREIGCPGGAGPGIVKLCHNGKKAFIFAVSPQRNIRPSCSLGIFIC